MDKLEENAIKIANYLEEKMTPVEEEAFMKELGDDDSLREQYEGELLVQTLLQNEAWVGEETAVVNFENPIFREAAGQDETGENGGGENKRGRVVSFFDRYKMAVAASVILVAGALLFFLERNGNTPGPGGPGSGTIAGRKSGGAKDGNTQPPPEQLSHNDDTVADSLFTKYFTRYAGDNDPAAVSVYFDDYQRENYPVVLAAVDTGNLVPGDSIMSETARQYIRLYKGLSYLDQGMRDEALEAFKSVLDAAPPGQSSYYEAQWYAALTWLKKHESEKAAALAGDISKSASPYSRKAAQLLTELK